MLENFKQIYTRYLDKANGDPLRAALRLAMVPGIFHDNAEEYQEALRGLIREALCQRNAKVGV